MSIPFIELNLSNFNPKDQVEFIPYFVYDGILKRINSVTVEIPSFPSLLSTDNTKAERREVNKIDTKLSVLDTTQEFRITAYRKPKADFIQIFLEKEWYYPRDMAGNKVVFDKTGVTDKSASTLLPLSEIVFTASPGNSASPLNDLKLQLTKVENAPPATIINKKRVIPKTGSVVLSFTSNNIPSALPISNNLVTVNTSNAALKDFRRYETYNTWVLSVTDKQYGLTLNNNKYIKDVVIFSFSIDNGKTKYLLNKGDNIGSLSEYIDVTDSLPTYSNISSFYIFNNRNNNGAILSLQMKIYNSSVSSEKIKFFARVIRFIDPTGNSSFSKASSIQDHNWVDMAVVK